jgi:hypothetical protein
LIDRRWQTEYLPEDKSYDWFELAIQPSCVGQCGGTRSLSLRHYVRRGPRREAHVMSRLGKGFLVVVVFVGALVASSLPWQDRSSSLRTISAVAYPRIRAQRRRVAATPEKAARRRGRGADRFDGSGWRLGPHVVRFPGTSRESPLPIRRPTGSTWRWNSLPSIVEFDIAQGRVLRRFPLPHLEAVGRKHSNGPGGFDVRAGRQRPGRRRLLGRDANGRHGSRLSLPLRSDQTRTTVREIRAFTPRTGRRRILQRSSGIRRRRRSGRCTTRRIRSWC